jgi:hypothetical protein
MEKVTRQLALALAGLALSAFTVGAYAEDTTKEKKMKYIALIYADPALSPAYGSPEFGAYMGAYNQATDAYKAGNAYVGGEALELSNTATTVRVRKGKTESMDGPFTETKEQLGGFYILECNNLDEAIKYAAMIPDAAFGAVEVRPIMNLEQ